MVSVADKADFDAVRCEPRRRAKANHPMTGRKRSDDIKTGVESLPRDEPGGYLFTAQAVSGIEVARAWFRLWYGTWEPVPRYRRPFIGSKRSPGWREREPQVAETTRG